MSRDDGPPNAATLRERRRPPPRETGWPRSRESAGSHPPGPVAPWLGSAFGLVFACRRTVTGIAPHEGAIPADATVLAPESPAGAALRGRRLRRLDHADGRLGMTIDDLGERGYRIAAPGVASFRVSCDGLRVHVDEPARAQGWERLLVGQVLPLAAALRGCEPLHASAVSIGGRVLAIAGDSGAGKSTLAAHLALRGNPLLADDVLSLSLDSDGRPLAHRGASSLSLSRDRDELGARLRRAGLGVAIGPDPEGRVLLDAAAAAAPLGAICLLGRARADEPLGAPRAATLADLLRVSYIRYVETPARMRAQLEILAAVARDCPVIAVDVDGARPRQLAMALEAEHARDRKGAAAVTSAPLALGTRPPLTRTAKLSLVAEILRVYLRVRWHMREHDIRRIVVGLRGGELAAGRTDPPLARRLGRAVARTLSFLPTDNRCLARSLVLDTMMRRRALRSVVVVGARSEPSFAAHAWVEHDGVPVLPPGSPSYRRLIEL